MANKDNPNGFKVAYTLNDGPPVMDEISVAADEVIKAGDAVYIGNDGYLYRATSATTRLLGVAAADADATGKADGDISVKIYLASLSTVFEGQCSGTPAQNNLFEAVDIEGPSGQMEINEDSKNLQVVKIIGFHPSDEAGPNRRVRFIIPAERNQFANMPR